MEDKIQPVEGLPPVGDPEATAVRRRNVKSHHAILRATRELVREAGYARLTIEGIAAKAGVGKSTIYRWWRSKGELVVEALAEVLEARPTPDSGDTRQDLTAIVHQAMALYDEETGTRAIIAGLVSDMHHNPDFAEALRKRLIRPRRTGNREAIERAIARGDLAADTDVELLIDLLAAPIAYRALITDAPITDDLANELVDRVLGPEVT
jgi:AcrR family transcriptional regulator